MRKDLSASTAAFSSLENTRGKSDFALPGERHKPKRTTSCTAITHTLAVLLGDENAPATMEAFVTPVTVCTENATQLKTSAPPHTKATSAQDHSDSTMPVWMPVNRRGDSNGPRSTLETM